MDVSIMMTLINELNSTAAFKGLYTNID